MTATKTAKPSTHAEVLKEQDEKTERGKRLITHIAMSCSNDYTVIDSLMEILELFTIRDSNLTFSDIAEDLQTYLFTWTREHGDARSDWKEEVLSGKKYPNEFGENEGEEQHTGDAEIDNLALTLAGHTLQILANKISHILQSDKVSDDAKQAFQSIVFNAANEGNVAIDDPQLIKISLPLIIDSLEFNYGKGIVHSLGFLLDSGIADPIEDELSQYEKRFDGKESE
jgi:hypothetical protein